MKTWCPILSKDLDAELENAFPGMASAPCQDYNTIDNKDGEITVADLNWQDFINTNGQPVYYYVYGFDMERANKIFGEDVLAEYQEPFEIKIYLDIKDVPKNLGPYGGFFADDNVTGYIHIKTFEKTTANNSIFETLKLRHEPKPKDVIQIISFGCDRPGARGANYYEIINKEDQLLSQQMNLSYGHYVWQFTAKRFMFSHEPGAIEPFGESGNCQTYENKMEGLIPPNETVETMDQDKAYDFNIDKESKEKIFNQNVKNQDDIYGGYYS